MSIRDDFENLMFEIIETRPSSAETISAITGLPINYVLMKLYMLEKHKIVERVTKKNMIIWGIPREMCVKGKCPKR